MTRTAQDRVWILGIRSSAASTAVAIALVLVLLVLATPSAPAQSFSVLYTFTGAADGFYPNGGLVRDQAGNLYGTTAGLFFEETGETLFKLDTTGQLIVLHTFDGRGNGLLPSGDLIRDAEGNLYGTTVYGGYEFCNNHDYYGGCGTLFKVNERTGKWTVLSKFKGRTIFPDGGLFRDPSGNLYGATPSGGAHKVGIVFKVDKSGTRTVVHNFTKSADGGISSDGTIRTGGHLYGTTPGPCNTGCGTVFKIDERTGKWTVLHSFAGGTDGSGPIGHLADDKAGNLYGTTFHGGDLKCDAPYGCGTVYEVNERTGDETVLYSFTDGDFGDYGEPSGGLVRDASGNLYGTTSYGGDLNCNAPYGCGTIFKVDERTASKPFCTASPAVRMEHFPTET